MSPDEIKAGIDWLVDEAREKGLPAPTFTLLINTAAGVCVFSTQPSGEVSKTVAMFLRILS